MAGYLPSYKRTARERYEDHEIEVVFYRPDVGLQVDGETIGSFYISTAAALKVGRRHVDELIRASYQ